MFTKKMADQNRQMEARAREIYPQGEAETIKTLQTEFPEVSEPRIRRMVEKVFRLKTVRQKWGGARPNSGRPPLPDGERRDRVSVRLLPGYKEKAQACADALGLGGGGRAIEEALNRLAKDLGL